MAESIKGRKTKDPEVFEYSKEKFPLYYKSDKQVLRLSSVDECDDELIVPANFKRGEKFRLVYFMRSSNYHVFGDSPCMGATETSLEQSSLQGPYAEEPSKPNEERSSEEKRFKYIKRLIPESKFPIKLIPCELHSIYFRRTPDFHLNDKINVGLVKKVQDASIPRLVLEAHRQEGVEIKSGELYRATLNECFVQIHAEKENPLSLGFEFLGRKKDVYKAREKLGVDFLRQCFKGGSDLNYYLTDSSSAGFLINYDSLNQVEIMKSGIPSHHKSIVF